MKEKVSGSRASSSSSLGLLLDEAESSYSLSFPLESSSSSPSIPSMTSSTSTSSSSRSVEGRIRWRLEEREGGCWGRRDREWRVFSLPLWVCVDWAWPDSVDSIMCESAVVSSPLLLDGRAILRFFREDVVKVSCPGSSRGEWEKGGGGCQRTKKEIRVVERLS